MISNVQGANIVRSIFRQGMSLRRVAIAAALLLPMSVAFAQSMVTPEDEYRKLIKVNEDLQSLGENPFGERISLYDGSLSFEQVDVSVPGTGPTITIGREFTLHTSDDRPDLQNRAFGDWDIDLPEIVTTTANQNNVQGWLVDGAINQKDVCTGFSAPPSVAAPAGDSARSDWEPDAWWQGYQLHIPGQGNQDLLQRSTENAASPSATFYQVSYMDFPIVTTQNWTVGCVQHAATDPATQSFMAIAPDGTRYWLGYLTYRYMPTIHRPLFSSPSGFVAHTDAVLSPALSTDDLLVRREGRMLVDRVQDRFGNFITYTYSGDQVVAIDGSDGRHVSIAYVPGTPQISTVTVVGNSAGSRTWTYGYTKVGLLTQLTSIVQPDGSTWSFNMTALNNAWVNMQSAHGTCDVLGTPGGLSNTYTGTMTHPSGLSGSFTVMAIKRGRSYVPRDCFAGGPNQPDTPTLPGTYATTPNAWYNMSIVQRQLSGTGIGTQTWNYAYSPSFESWIQNCSAGCPSTVWTKVIYPDGHAERSTFSNRYDYSESLLLGEEIFNGDADVTALRRNTEYGYVNPDPTIDARAASYAHPWGFAPQGRVNRAQTGEHIPMAIRDVFQDGDQLEWSASAYDVMAQPTSVERVNNLGFLVQERTSYLNDFPHWMIGLPTTSENLTTGETVSENVYNTTDFTLLERHRFGSKVMSYTFNPQGQLATFTDGNSHTTSLQNYYRGIPRTVLYPDNTGQSLAVDDLGQITAIANQKGDVTSYGYDAIGRLSTIVYPVGDPVAWNAQHIVYELMPAADRNIGAAHWRKTTTQGNSVDQLYYDAMLRPIIHDSHPADNSIYYSKRTDYDWRGNESFQSYWYTGAPLPASMGNGLVTSRDVLNRPSGTRHASELGDLTTTIAYLGGGRSQATDQKGNVTTYTYQMFDEPAYDQVVHVQAPESVDQGILRDTYGNPLIITQDGAGQLVSRKLTYDSAHRLCRTWEPETGSEIRAYDNADNLAWSVSGASFNGTGCGQDQVVDSSKTVRAYDAMNRVTSVVYPAGTQPSTFTYDALGYVATSTSGAVGWTFGRNRRGLLTSETLSVDGHNWTLGYSYDANGTQSAVSYPDGEFVPYNPDPLGRPTIVGSYVSALSIFKEGTIQFYLMGSGATYVGTKNLRETYSNFAFRQNGVTPVVSENITYDANGNVTQLTDIATNSQRTKSMAYDGVDRLVSATASNLWGTESYTYDTLNNIRSLTNSSGTNTYNYDAFNLLSSISNNGVAQHTFRYDARGNTVAKDAQNLNFDQANRLTSIDGKGTYTYDASGRRVRKVTPTGTTYYAYNSAGKLMWEYDAATSNGTNYIYLAGKLIASSKGPSL
jgi:YD repeat-containing protein